MCGVSSDGTVRAKSAISLILPFMPVKETVTQPISFPFSIARMTFFEFPEVDSPTITSPGRAIASTCLENTMS